jgi:hypothetical protein
MTDYRYERILPTELKYILKDNDWSILDEIDDEHYTKCVEHYVEQLLTYEGLSFVRVLDDSYFRHEHEMSDYGVLGCKCSTFLFN